MRLTLPLAVLFTLCCSAPVEIDAKAPKEPPKASPAAKPAEIPHHATAQCVDKTWSSSRQRSGACSSHGGIKTWFGSPPKGAVARCNDGSYTKSADQGACSSHGGVAYPLPPLKD